MSFWQNRRIPVAGAVGFIDGNLSHFFVQEGAHATSLERNVEKGSCPHFKGLGPNTKVISGDFYDQSFLDLERFMSAEDYEFCLYPSAKVELGVGLKHSYQHV